MPDKLHRFLLENLNVRGEWVSIKDSWKAIQNTADYPKPVRNVLGEALAAVSLLAESLKFDGRLILQIRGTHPVSMLLAQANSDGTIRGIAKWQDDIADDASFSQLFGSGTMIISVENHPKAGAQQGERYQSLVSLEGASLAECLKQYFAQSEQLETQLWLAVNDDTVAGLMLQSVASDKTIVNAIANQENNWEHARVLADTLTQEELLSLDVKELLHCLYHEEDLRLYDANPIAFKCSCSQEKVEKTVYALGEKDVNALIKEKGNISIDCEFCNTHYVLDKIDVARLFANGIVPASGQSKGIVH